MGAKMLLNGSLRMTMNDSTYRSAVMRFIHEHNFTNYRRSLEAASLDGMAHDQNRLGSQILRRCVYVRR